MIDPNTWEDPNFGSLTRDARLLFLGLISNADDFGYLRGHPGSLKRLIFGFDDDMSASATQVLLNEVASKITNVNIYKVDGQTYVHLCKWEKYQRQQKDRMVASIFPLCSKCLADAQQVPPEEKGREGKLDKIRLDKVKSSEVRESGITTHTQLKDDQLQQIADDYHVPLSFVLSKQEDLSNWMKSSGKTYTDIHAALRRWVKKDALGIRKEANDRSKIVLINPK